MRTTLVYPPNRNVPSSPYGALPLLAGCLGEAGHEVSVVDANLEVFERLLAPETVDQARAHFRTVWDDLRSRESLSLTEAHLLQSLAQLAVVPLEAYDEAEDAGRVLRDRERFADPAAVNAAYDRIQNLLRFLYTLNPQVYLLQPEGLDRLFGHLESDFVNPIQTIVDEVVIDKILATDPELVAVSIPFNEQLVEAFAILRSLRARAPHVRVVIGGAIVSAYHEVLCADERFWRYADFAMPGEVDLAFPAFVTALERGAGFDGVTNLWRRAADGTPVPPTRLALPNLSEIACPDFAAIELDRYFLPVGIVNYQTSRGCYYGKCTFCSDDIKQNYRLRRTDLVCQDIERIQQQTGMRHFIFWDPLTPPKVMKDVSKWNRERPEGERIYWGAETKFEKLFTKPEFTDLLHEGGGRFLQFGFESGSQRVIDLMVKGNDLERVHEMLDCLSGSGLAVSVQWFIGFPGETREEALRSFTYLDQHRESVMLSSYMGTFTLSPTDDISRSGGDMYGIDIFQKPDGALDFRYRDGSDHYDREELHAAYLSRSDHETVTRMAFYVYLTEFPERARELSNFDRGGLFPLGWEDLADTTPGLPSTTWVRSFDFDAFTPPTEQGLGPDGGRLPATPSHAAFVTATQLVYRLDDADLALVRGAAEGRTADELVEAAAAASGAPAEALRARLVGHVRRGILRVPLARPVGVA